MENSAIISRLNSNLEDVLTELAPGWVAGRNGIAYLTPKNSKKLGSFHVNLCARGGFPRGSWRRWSRGIGGGELKLAAYLLTGVETPTIADYAKTFEWLKDFFNLTNEQKSKLKTDKNIYNNFIKTDDSKNKSRKISNALKLWSQTKPISGTLGEVYLKKRGIELPSGVEWPDCLRFHPRVEWEIGSEWDGSNKINPGPYFPCLIASVVDSNGELSAVWRIFLDDNGDKANLIPAKIGLGSVAGCAVRIGGNGPKVGIAEGIETALASWLLIGRKYPVWSVLSTSGMANFEPPPFIKCGTIFPDGDRPIKKLGDDFVPAEPAGRAAARQMASEMRRAGMQWTIEAEPPAGKDYLDLFVMTQGSFHAA